MISSHANILNFGLSRPQSRLSTSRRGSGWRPACYLDLDTLDTEQRLEGGGLYDSRKPRLSPLIEVIEPTPPLCRSTPIFGLTGVLILLTLFGPFIYI